MVINKALRDAADVSLGDEVHVIINIDKGERTVDIPSDFRRALNKNKAAKAAFEKFSFSHKKEYVGWIEGAKKDETRLKRVTTAISKLAKGPASK